LNLTSSLARINAKGTWVIMMSHKALQTNDRPHTIESLATFPETEEHLSGLVQAVMTGPSSRSVAERKLIADECVKRIAPGRVNDKLRALLAIAGKVGRDGRIVTKQDVQLAREAGADDKAIHDTVLIAAVFCMFHRYIDGLASWRPRTAWEGD
jgi:alkylhydroperoxidase family enzyme